MSILRFEEAYTELTKEKFDWGTPHSQRLLAIFKSSPALSEKLIKNSLWADDFLANPAWDRKKTAREFQNEFERILDTTQPGDIKTWQKTLRHFKYREMIRIVAKDLATSPPVKDTLLEWSDLADTIISNAYDAASKMCAAQFGAPSECTGAVIALGKLGGRELNLSSDVDLLCLYSTDEGGGKLSNHEFFSKVITLMTQLLSAITEDGFAFRVDHDLRPEGPKGPLVNSVDAAERYYETFGQDWERQSLIRARAVAGDLNLGQQFIAAVTPFVYRRSLSLNDISHLKEMKHMMESAARDPFQNIKLGRGGIRELEFLIQAFQQVFGGQKKEIRTQNTFDAIALLEKKHLIHPYGAKGLKTTYSFLRRLENMIQVSEDQQTHTIPKSADEIALLNNLMGCDILIEWRRHSRFVHRLFTALFDEDYERLELEEAMDANLATCSTDEERADSLAWFKHQEIRRLTHLDLNDEIGLVELLRRLTRVAEVVLHTASKLAFNSLQKRFGEPLLENGARASFAIIGFGRLGSGEMDYGSDLDLCFLYSGDGITTGPEVISNAEFFTKLSQRIISNVSIHSRYGRAYQIDSELRPSGRQGSLVATLESFRDYHMTMARLWERLALLKTRTITGNEAFLKEARIALTSLAYKLPADDDMRREISDLRRRVETESASERDGVYNLKVGWGGIADVEAIMQFLQLENVRQHPGLWVQNGFEVLKALHQINVITDEFYDILSDIYRFYRLLITRLRLYADSATNLLDFKAPYIDSLANSVGFSSPDTLRGDIERYRKITRDLYNKFFG